MKIKTFWWGAELTAVNAGEFAEMEKLFAHYEFLGGYDNDSPEDAVHIDREKMQITISR